MSHDASEAISSVPSSATTQKTDPSSRNDLAATPLPGTDEQKLLRINEIREVVNHANQPVRFYGLVVDQNNSPIPGVQVRLTLKHTDETLPGVSRDALDYLDESTDIQGRFSLVGKHGSLLTVQSLEKAGYEAPYVGNRAFWYEEIVAGRKYMPDEAKPEVFRMWKKAGAERLVRKSIGQPLKYDGTPTSFDLLAGKVSTSGGDLKVTLVRKPQIIKWGQRDYDWTATVEVPDGGVVETTSEFKYLAPESGYQSKLVIHMAADDPKWTDMKNVAVFVKIRGQYYGRAELQLTVGSDRQTTPFSITSFINLNGSRNLEYDPMQEVSAH